jgi:regulator of protease activity HflC (stomatin/prohibitin superfamily)
MDSAIKKLLGKCKKDHPVLIITLYHGDVYNMNTMNKFRLAAGAAAALLMGSVILGSWYTVEETERTVVLRNGAFSKVAEPGLNFKFPFIDRTIDISMQDHKMTLTGDIVEAYSADQQPANMTISVNYSVDPNPELLREFYKHYAGNTQSFEQRTLSPVMLNQLKIVFGQFTAQKAVQDRDELIRSVAAAIKQDLGTFVRVSRVNIENIAFSPTYVKSIEEKQLAEVEVLKVRQNGERVKEEAKIVVTKAEAEAQAVRARASAEAEAIKIKGLAEAEAITARGKAVRENAGLVDLQAVEKWDGKLPITMVPGSSLPFINVK